MQNVQQTVVSQYTTDLYCTYPLSLYNRRMSKRQKYSTDEERKAARQASSKKWREANQEKHREAVKRCRQTDKAREAHRIRARESARRNPEQNRLKVLAWRTADPERAQASRRAYYVANRDKMKAASKAYREANPALVKEWSMQNKHRRRAGSGSLTKGYVQLLWASQGGFCKACEGDLTKLGHHVDHIVPLSKGGLHCDDNVQLLCPTCNLRKHDMDFPKFLKLLRG